jgi:hypothetical protein
MAKQRNLPISGALLDKAKKKQPQHHRSTEAVRLLVAGAISTGTKGITSASGRRSAKQKTAQRLERWCRLD